MAEFKVGAKVKYRNMAMPAEILSGPHKSPGNDRYLIRKADGNVSLVPVAHLERIRTRDEYVGDVLARAWFGRPLSVLTFSDQVRVLGVAARTVRLADDTRGQI